MLSPLQRPVRYYLYECSFCLLWKLDRILRPK